MNKPLISLIIPCYNQGAFINEALQSVYNQTYSNWECVVVNDGSTDDSESIAIKWVNKDNRFKYFYKNNNGVSSARNFALEKVNGAYIQFLDADDLLNSRKLELSLNALVEPQSENKQIVISNFRLFSNKIKNSTAPYCILISELFTFESILYKWNESFSIPIHCGFFEVSLFEDIRFSENLTAQEDWVVWVEIFKLDDVEAVFLDQPLALYRQNPEGRTKTKSLFEDQILAYEHLKTILTDNEFYKLSIVLISRYYKTQEDIKKRLRVVKNSNTYQTGMMIKKVLKTVGLLRVSRKVFPLFLKFKSK